MKKINRDGIRALILETLDEMSLGEAKKKVDEVAPEDSPEHGEQLGQLAHELETDDPDIEARMSAPVVDVKTLTNQFQEAVKATIEARRTKDKLKNATAEAAVKFVLDQVKNISGDNK